MDSQGVKLSPCIMILLIEDKERNKNRGSLFFFGYELEHAKICRE